MRTLFRTRHHEMSVLDPCWLAFYFSGTQFPHLKSKGTWARFLQFLAFWFVQLESQLGSLTPVGYLIPQEKERNGQTHN